MLSCDHSVIVLTETWLKMHVLNSEYFHDNYNVFRKDRDRCRGGGVLIAIDNTFASEELDFHCTITEIDCMACKISFKNTVLIIIAIYIPPSLRTEIYGNIFDMLENSFDFSSNNILIVGDFNIPDLQNLNDNCMGYKPSALLNDFINFNDLLQHNNITNDSNKTLDLVISSRTTQLSVSRHLHPLVTEDSYHPCLSIDCSFEAEETLVFKSNNKPRYNFRRADYPGMYQALASENWDDLYKIADANDACSYFYDIIYSIFDTFVPVTLPCRSDYPSWFNADIISNIKERKRLWKQYKKTKLISLKVKANNIQNKIRSQVKKEYISFLKRSEENIRLNPNDLWSYINSKKKCSNIPGKMKLEQQELTSCPDIVNSFASFFSSTYVKNQTDTRKPASPELPSFNNNATCDKGVNVNVLHNFDISVPDIRTAVKKMKANLNMGPDSIPALIIRDCFDCLDGPLCYIFNLILHTSVYPDAWKLGKITPVYKSGDKTSIQNYRPVTLISNVAKLFELVIANNISSHVRRMITINQHGFMRGRSTFTNLCDFTQLTSEALDNRLQLDVVYTDLSKAFDRVDHNLLFQKLHQYGFGEDLINTFKSMYTDRRQYVEVRGFKSAPFFTNSGVIQGSTLGPLLFILFINDVVDRFDCRVFLYADDLKIVNVIHSIDDCYKLQKDLNSLVLWCNENKLPLNVSKCKTLSFSRKSNTIYFDYQINDNVLERCNQFKDLGVTFDTTLSFIPHINSVVAQCLKLLGFIIRNTRSFENVCALKMLYYAFIRSKLEYCSIIWSSCYNVHSNSVDKVQRRFLKYLYYVKHAEYPRQNYPTCDLLAEFNEEASNVRNIKSQLLTLYKIINNNIDCPTLTSQLLLHVPRINSRNCPTFSLKTPNTKNHMFSPMLSMCRTYNNICNTIDIFHLSYNNYVRSINALLYT